MCGLYGSLSVRGVSRTKLTVLGLLSERRGIDAAGFWTPSLGVNKFPIPSSLMIRDILPDYWRFITRERIFLGHCRAASNGSPLNNNNNHPIEGEKLILMHNGIAHMNRLKGYSYRGETDSETILSYLEIKGQKGLKQITGSASLVWVDKDKPNEIFLWRHFSPLYLLFEKEAIYFASSWHYLKQISHRKVYKLKEHDLMKISIFKDKVVLSKIRVIKPKRSFIGYYIGNWRINRNQQNLNIDL